MNVFVPFTKLRSETFSAVPTATFIPLLDKEMGYGQYFRDRWREGKTFINVEHDVVPDNRILELLWDCDQPFCFAGYVYPGQTKFDTSYLGCAKISEQLIKENPNLFDDPVIWYGCEGRILELVNGRLCCHGSVLHLHIDETWPIEEATKYG